MKFVDLQKYGFLIEPRYYFFGWTKEKRVMGRESAVKALLRAQKLLPAGHRFKIWDMQRPRALQIIMRESFRKRLEIHHPKANKAQIEKLVNKFGALPLPDKQVVRPDCHRNGGAVDLTIVNRNGVELYMGTDHDDLTDRAATRYFHNLKNPGMLDLLAKKNRNILIRAMSKAGWDELPAEWWHWSTVE
ncbi:MAG TPA: M15 family metallopeptidase [Candidatus Binatia bacterium]|nr:M15 family metallopeptidase [Candidatus Binatia bacterium]